jgi:thioredoxin reductase (NADPH)
MRAVLIAEAELGERLMRALILRRAQMLKDGVGGPVIVGRSENPNVIRLEGFLARNGTPRMRLDPETDPEARALIDRFQVDSGQLPIVLCPGGQVLRNPSDVELARCLGLIGPIDPNRILSAPARPASPPPFMPPRKDFPSWYLTAARSVGKRALRRVSKTI